MFCASGPHTPQEPLGISFGQVRHDDRDYHPHNLMAEEIQVHAPFLNGGNLLRKPFALPIDPLEWKFFIIPICGHNAHNEAQIANQEEAECSEWHAAAEMAMNNIYI